MLEEMGGSPDEDIQLHTIMEWLMDRYPGVIPMLVRKRMACVGCCMAVFDSVEDAARYHGLDAAGLLADLRAAAQKSGQPNSDDII